MSTADGPRHTARAIVVHDNQLLLMERWRDDLHYFSIPGGGIEADEVAEETVVREILEETSIDVEVIRLVLEMHAGEVVHQIYLCKYLSGTPELQEHAPEFIDMTPNNRFKPTWMPLEQINDLPYVYWEPLKVALVEALENGFTEEVKIVTVS